MLREIPLWWQLKSNACMAAVDPSCPLSPFCNKNSVIVRTLRQAPSFYMITSSWEILHSLDNSICDYWCTSGLWVWCQSPLIIPFSCLKVLICIINAMGFATKWRNTTQAGCQILHQISHCLIIRVEQLLWTQNRFYDISLLCLGISSKHQTPLSTWGCNHSQSLSPDVWCSCTCCEFIMGFGAWFKPIISSVKINKILYFSHHVVYFHLSLCDVKIKG